jgi:hypothetical protein
MTTDSSTANHASGKFKMLFAHLAYFAVKIAFRGFRADRG